MNTHSNTADTRKETSNDKNDCSGYVEGSVNSVHRPNISQTGLGYSYVRCQRGDDDATVYIHQLCAIAAGEDPHDVFSDAYDVHHKSLSADFDLDVHVSPLPIELPKGLLTALDTPESVELQGRWEHRERNLDRGDADA